MNSAATQGYEEDVHYEDMTPVGSTFVSAVKSNKLNTREIVKREINSKTGKLKDYKNIAKERIARL